MKNRNRERERGRAKDTDKDGLVERKCREKTGKGEQGRKVGRKKLCGEAERLMRAYGWKEFMR